MSTNSTAYMREYINKKQSEIIDALGGRCLICASRSFLEVHHIFGYQGNKVQGRGKNIRVLDWFSNMDKLALLCHKHHVEYHQFCNANITSESLLDYILHKFIENEEFVYI